jgi:hypothetical protein
MFLELEFHQVRVILRTYCVGTYRIGIDSFYTVTREEWKVVAHEIGHGFGNYIGTSYEDMYLTVLNVIV